ncbi:MAG: Holliday junction resolvase RuvX [Rickettsiales bacterium]
MLFDSSAEFINTLSKDARLLGIDLGDKTIGLALSDVMRSIASPMETIERTKFGKDVVRLQKIISEQRVGGLVVGNPMNMDGSSGPRVQATRTFISNVQKHIDIPVILWDERMSTMAVERMMVGEGDLSRKRRGELVDKLAASYMLQGFLDSLK